MTAQLTIGEVAQRLGIRTSAIRYYDEVGLIPKPARRNGRRVFGDEVFDHLAVVRLAQAAGFSIAEIKSLKNGLARAGAPGPRWRDLAQRKIRDLDQQIATAIRMKQVLTTLSRCECPTLQDCGRSIRQSSGRPSAGRTRSQQRATKHRTADPIDRRD